MENPCPVLASRSLAPDRSAQQAGDLRRNRLLGALSAADIQRLLPLLERVELPLGQVLFESGVVQAHTYFLTTAVVRK
jgi:hypothetical protein